jgi:hypothetical protein
LTVPFIIFSVRTRESFWTSNNDSGLRRVAFPIVGISDLEIDGQGSEFVFHGAITPFLIQDSRNITLRNISIDWSHPPVVTGIVDELTADEVLLSVDEDSTYRISDGKLIMGPSDWEVGTDGFIELDAKTLAPAYRTGDTWRDGPGGWQESFHNGTKPSQIAFRKPRRENISVGNHIVFLRGDRNNPGIVLSEADDVVIEHVTVYRAPAMALIAQSCGNVTLRGFNVMLKPGTDRVVTASADATHFVNCYGLITLDDCLFEGQLDDATNVHGVYLEVLKRIGDRDFMLGRMHGQQKGVPYLGIGDQLQFSAPDSLMRIASSRIVSLSEINQTEILVTLAETVCEDVMVGVVAEDIDRCADFVARHCIVRRNRARGFLISTAGKVLIDGNRFSPGGVGVLIPGECCGWYESGAVKDVTIRNNEFVDCMTSRWGRSPIDITPGIPKLSERETPFHGGIVIENNVFEVFDDGLVAAWSVDGLTVRNNTVIKTDRFQPYMPPVSPVDVRYCTNVVVGNNGGK